MTDTVGYYNLNAARYVADTVEVDLSALRQRFLAQVPAGGFILDAGCGSGRDSYAFLQQGYRVRAFDAASEIAHRAAEHIKQPVQVQRFEGLDATLPHMWHSKMNTRCPLLRLNHRPREETG